MLCPALQSISACSFATAIQDVLSSHSFAVAAIPAYAPGIIPLLNDLQTPAAHWTPSTLLAFGLQCSGMMRPLSAPLQHLCETRKSMRSAHGGSRSRLASLSGRRWAQMAPQQCPRAPLLGEKDVLCTLLLCSNVHQGDI